MVTNRGVKRETTEHVKALEKHKLLYETLMNADATRQFEMLSVI